MSTPVGPEGLPDITLITGPVVLGYLFNLGLFGALTVQCYMYYLAFPNDSRSMKCVVTVTYLLQVVQVVLTTIDAFRQYAAGWGDFLQLTKFGLLWFSVPILDGIVSAFVQTFYAWRIFAFSRNVYVSCVVVTMALFQLVFAIYSGALLRSDNLNRMYQVATITWLSGTVVCDVTIAVSMIFLLQRARRRSGIERTTILLTRLITLTFETGAVCATFAIVNLVLFIRFQHTLLQFLPSLTLAKPYSNMLLAVFNSRIDIIGGRNRPASQENAFVWTMTTGRLSPHSAKSVMHPEKVRSRPIVFAKSPRIQDVRTIELGRTAKDVVHVRQETEEADLDTITFAPGDPFEGAYGKTKPDSVYV